MDDTSDQDIIESYLEGDTEAFKKLVDRYTKPLYNYALRFVKPNDVEDILQETFIKAWRHIKNFNPDKASFKTWLFTILKNTATDFLRKKKAWSFSDLNREDAEEDFEEKIEDESLLPDEMLARLEESEYLNQILEKLSPKYREVLVLHYQEEMTFEEIGQVLGKSLNTVKSQHRRAILELRERLKITHQINP